MLSVIFFNYWTAPMYVDKTVQTCVKRKRIPTYMQRTSYREITLERDNVVQILDMCKQERKS